MARKRDLFFHSIFAFLSRCQLTLRRQWLYRCHNGHHLSLALYGGLATITFIYATMLPGLAGSSILLSHNTFGDTIAQIPEQTLPDQSEAQRLGQLARDYYDAGQLDIAAETFEAAAAHFQQLGYPNQAMESLVNQAKVLQGMGLYNQAIVILQKVLNLQNNNQLLQERLNEIMPSQITVVALRSLGDALQIVGDLEQAKLFLDHSRNFAEKLSLTSEIGPTYLSLGNLTRTQAIATLRLSNLTIDQAIKINRSRNQLNPIQQELQRSQIKAVQTFETQTNNALHYYEQATINRSSPLLTQVQARLNALSLLLDRQQWQDAAAVGTKLYPLLDSLSLSRASVEAYINLAHSLMRLDEVRTSNIFLVDPLLQATRLLETAYKQSNQLSAAQTESYVLGSLGELYMRREQWRDAEIVTEKALEKINAVSVTNFPLTINDVDLAYRWYRQLGKILNQQNNLTDNKHNLVDNKQNGLTAIEAYEMAVKLLQKRLRLDAASGNLNSQFSFVKEIQEPVYKELIDLLLQHEEPSQKNLQRVREISSSLLESELTGFLQEPCTLSGIEDIDRTIENQKAALIYPIVLDDRLEVIVKLPGVKDLFHYRSNDKNFVSKDLFFEQLKELKTVLEEDYTFEEVKRLSGKFYDLIIKPVESKLTDIQVDTLIFTRDLELQNIPMAVLYDGEKGNYLIEKFAIAEFLELKVKDTAKPLRPDDFNIIAAGLSSVPSDFPAKFKNNFLPLPYVNQELTKIKNLEEGSGIDVDTLSDKNSDEDFTLGNFNARLNADKFPVVHLATHGQFSVYPEDTFLLTSAEKFEESKVDVPELAKLFRLRGAIRLDAIELLILNACETASGDNLATLGIAGTAVKAGARSTIASLWTLNDELSVEFTKILYDNLKEPNTTKAEALRQAQLALLSKPQYRHPRYWAPYILAGNWLPLTSTSSR